MNCNIDFDYASREWNKNNNICKKKPQKYTDYCHIHKP